MKGVKKSAPLPSPTPPSLQSFVAEAMLIMATVLHLGKSSLPKKPITDDDVDRISLCLKVLSECSPLMNRSEEHTSELQSR